MRYAVAIASAVILSIAAVPCLAGNDHTKAPHGSGGPQSKFDVRSPARTVVFTDADSTLVRVYFAHNQVAWTGLPPGVAKNYARGKKLPYGIAKKALPADLQARLPQRHGYEYARVGQDVVLVELATGIVVDLIEGVFG
ncbi:MAG: anti-virulence regulator CigR family protein [Micropepsaceae bacterium]